MADPLAKAISKNRPDAGTFDIPIQRAIFGQGLCNIMPIARDYRRPLFPRALNRTRLYHARRRLAVLDHSRALQQGDGSARPAFAGGARNVEGPVTCRAACKEKAPHRAGLGVKGARVGLSRLLGRD